MSMQIETVHRLQESILSVIHGFNGPALKRARLLMDKYLDKKGAVLDKAALDESCRVFAQQIESEYADRIVPLVETRVADFQDEVEKNPGNVDVISSRSCKINDELTTTCTAILRRTLKETAAHCLQSASGVVYSKKEILKLSEIYAKDITGPLTRNNFKIIELFSSYFRARSAIPSHPLSKEDEDKGEDRTNAIALTDAFGRGLLNPVEHYYEIVDKANDRKTAKPTFPRIFCGPVLAVLRVFLIGSDKYNSVNSALLKSVLQYCQSEKYCDLSLLDKYFAHQNILEYINKYYLYMLKVLLKEAKRENFIFKINKELQERHPEKKLEFKGRHFTLICTAWARQVFDTTENIQENKKYRKILEEFIPAKFQ